MRRVVSGLCVVVLFCGVAYGQQTPGSNYEHLKCYDQLIGDWTYDGPIQEHFPGVGNKDTRMVGRFSWTWILDKNAVETVSSVELAGGLKISGKSLIGWDAARQRIIGGGMDNFGGYGLSTVTYDPTTKSWTSKEERTDGEGKTNPSTTVVTLSDPDTLVLQIIERTGGPVEGASPKYTFKRTVPPKRSEPVK